MKLFLRASYCLVFDLRQFAQQFFVSLIQRRWRFHDD